MKKRVLACMLGVAMVASCVAGYGSTSEKKTTETDLAQETGETAAADSAQETSSDGESKLIAGATTGFFGAESLDVANNWDGWIMSIYGISENLFRLDENYEPQPWIAESYENTDDTTWTFTIRDGVTFSDGTKVTAEAVKKCFERTYEKNERADSTLAIASMEADGQTFTIVTPEANPTLLNDLCDPLLGIYDADQEPDEQLGVSCTGPYIATSFTAMTDVQMKANENYWGGAPKTDVVELKIMDDEDSLNMALQNGEIDMIAQLSANGASLFEGNDDYTIDKVTTTRANFLMFNLKSEGIDDPAVREAINLCIDRDSFANVVYHGYAAPSYGIYPENLSFGGTDGLELTVDSYDAEKAKTKLTEAGYSDSDGDGILDKDGTALSFTTITYSYNTACMQLADMLQAELGNIGIQLNIETYDVLDDSLTSGAFDIAILNYAMAPIGTSQYFVNMMFTTGASNNYGSYTNEKVDTLAKELGVTMEKEKRDSITKEICQEVLNDQAFAFVADQQLIFAYSKKVSGIKINPTEYYLITNEIEVK